MIASAALKHPDTSVPPPQVMDFSVLDRLADWLDAQPPQRRRIYSLFLALALLTIPCYAAGGLLYLLNAPPPERERTEQATQSPTPEPSMVIPSDPTAVLQPSATTAAVQPGDDDEDDPEPPSPSPEPSLAIASPIPERTPTTMSLPTPIARITQTASPEPSATAAPTTAPSPLPTDPPTAAPTGLPEPTDAPTAVGPTAPPAPTFPGGFTPEPPAP